MNKNGHPEILGAHAANPAQPAPPGTTIGTGWCQSCGKVAPPKEVGHQCQCGAGAVELRHWGVSALEDRLKAQFTTEVRRRHRSVYLELEREDPGEADEMRSKYMTDSAAGMYNWEDDENLTNHVRQARTKTWGYLYLMFLILRRCDPQMTEQRVIEVCSANPEDAMSAYLWALNIPNRRAPSEQAQQAAAGATSSGSVPSPAAGETEGERNHRKQVEEAKRKAMAANVGPVTARAEAPAASPGTKELEPTFQ